MKIHSDVPPPKYTGKAWNTKYPWREMCIGDSILVDDAHNARRSAHGFADRNPGYFFTCRMEGKKLRIWRVPPPPEKGIRAVNRLGSW